MPEEIGKIEKPLAEDFKVGRKLFFAPLLFPGKDLPQEFQDKSVLYWEQVDSQIANLEAKLGPVNRIYHELLTDSGEDGIESIKQLNINSLKIVRSRMEKGAVLEATEDREIITELMDISRCLSLELQSQKLRTGRFFFLRLTLCGRLFSGFGFVISPPALDLIQCWWGDVENPDIGRHLDLIAFSHNKNTDFVLLQSVI